MTATLQASLRAVGRVSRGNPLLAGTASFFIATMLGQALSFVAHLQLTQQLSIGDYGIYIYHFSWIWLLAIVAVGGTDRLLVLFASTYQASGQRGLLRRAALYASTVVFTATDTSDARATLAAAMILPVFALVLVVEGHLRGLQLHASATWPPRLLRPLLFCGLLALAGLLLAAPMEPATAILLGGLAAAAVLPFGLATLRKSPNAPGRESGETPIVLPLRQWGAAAFALLLRTLLLNLNGQLDILLLGSMADPGALGAYGVAIRLVTLMSLPSTAVIAITQPMLAKAMALQDMDTARELIVTAARTVFGCSLVCALPLLAMPELVLSVFGSEFAASAPALRLLTLGYLAASFVSLANASLSMRGQQRPVVLCLLFGVAVSFALNLVLIPCYGMIGAAAANAISTVVWQAALFLIAHRRLGIWTCPLG